MPINLRPYQGQTDHATIAELDRLMGLGILNYCDPQQDMVFAEVGGQTVGYGRVWLNVRDDELRYFLEVNLHDSRAADVERQLFDWVQARAEAMRQTHPHSIAHANKVFAPDDRPSLITLLDQAGYTVERTDLTLTWLLADPIPDRPLPAGLELRPLAWQHGHQLAALMDEAFGMSGRDKVMTSLMDEAEFEAWLSGLPATVDASLAAWSVDEDNVVCMALNQIDEAAGRGKINHICTCQTWRRRGLARALIAHSLRAFQTQGLREAYLEVNDFNTPALQLYTHWGFQVISRSWLYSKAG